MKAKAMQALAHQGCHGARCAPKAWKDVPVVSGDYDLDATIQHRSNTDLPLRLAQHTRGGTRSYSPVTGYSGYRNYSGDS